MPQTFSAGGQAHEVVEFVAFLATTEADLRMLSAQHGPQSFPRRAPEIVDPDPQWVLRHGRGETVLGIDDWTDENTRAICQDPTVTGPLHGVLA